LKTTCNNIRYEFNNTFDVSIEALIYVLGLHAVYNLSKEWEVLVTSECQPKSILAKSGWDYEGM
jgi:hypothetical protein